MSKRRRSSVSDTSVGDIVVEPKSVPSRADDLPAEVAADSDGWTPVTRHRRRGKKSKKEHSDGRDRDHDEVPPSIDHSHHIRLHSSVKISDLQSLVLYILAEGSPPQWVNVRNHRAIEQVVVLMVPGLELGMFNGRLPLESSKSSPSLRNDSEKFSKSSSHTDIDERSRPQRLDIRPDDYYPASLQPHRLPDALKPLHDIFTRVWPVNTPCDKRKHEYSRVHSPIVSMLTSSIPKTQEEKRLKNDPRHKGPIPPSTHNWKDQRTPITEYIAGLGEQQEHGYVVHPAWYTTPAAKEIAHLRRSEAKQTSENGWIDTNVTSLEDGEVPFKEIEQGSATEGGHVLIVDCEMCKAEDDTLVLTRISMVDWDGKVILDQLVKPDLSIKDYVTQYSGITEAMLENVTTTLADVQRQLLGLITPRTILVGHSLNSDLDALKLTHPFIVDTSIIYPHTRGPPYRQSLKWLARKYLSKEIQRGDKGHDSVEDSLTCLELVKQKCQRGPTWGTSDANAESIFKRLGRTRRPSFAQKSENHNLYRTGAVVDWGEPTRGHGSRASVTIACESDQDVIDGIKDAVNGNASNRDGAREHVDLVWSRFRDLELYRGWWAHARTDDYEEIRHAALKRLGRLSTADAENADPIGSELGAAVARTVHQIVEVYKSLPARTAFIVYSGGRDPREVYRLQNMRQQFQKEYRTTNWDNLSVKWTDKENIELSDACALMREGIGFVAVK